MLQYAGIYTKTLALLRELLNIKMLEGYALCGGTALALQIGHRKSVNLVLFSFLQGSDFDEILNELTSNHTIKIFSRSKNIICTYIDNIKVDFVNYSYPIITPILNIDSIRLFSLEDISAMKLSAISKRGKKRDFYDICFLLEKYSINDIIGFFKQKFNLNDTFHLNKSLLYFNDAENEDEPELLIDISWKDVKSKIQAEVNKYLMESQF